jgi:hypothetical protein
MRSSVLLSCFAATLVSGSLSAQSRPTEFRAGFDLITSGIAPGAADSAGIGTRAFGAQLTGSVIAFRVLTLSAEGGIVGMSDEARFTQETTAGERSSGVGAGLGTLAAGLRTPPLGLGGTRPMTFSAALNAGHTWINVTRTITNCVDCHGEGVDVRAGSFWEPAVQVGVGRGVASARYRTYVGGSDFRNAVMVGYSVAPARRAPRPATPAPPS